MAYELPPYFCDTCGCYGNEEDGINGAGDDCPDENCDGTIQATRENQP